MAVLWESLGQCSSQIFQQLYVNIHLHNKSTAEASVDSPPLKGVLNARVSQSVCNTGTARDCGLAFTFVLVLT